MLYSRVKSGHRLMANLYGVPEEPHLASGPSWAKPNGFESHPLEGLSDILCEAFHTQRSNNTDSHQDPFQHLAISNFS